MIRRPIRYHLAVHLILRKGLTRPISVIIHLFIPGNLPHLKKCYGKAPYRISLHAHGVILPDAKPLHKIHIFVRKIHSARIADIAVDYHNLLVAAVVHIQLVRILVNRVKDPYFNSLLGQLLLKILRRAQHGSEIIIEEFDLHSLRRFRYQQLMHPLPENALEHCIERIFAHGIITNFVIPEQREVIRL